MEALPLTLIWGLLPASFVKCQDMKMIVTWEQWWEGKEKWVPDWGCLGSPFGTLPLLLVSVFLC